MKKLLMLMMFLFVLLGLTSQATAQAWQNEQIEIDAFTNENEVLIKLTPLNGGHILWDNPGDLGTPTTFQWSTPAQRLHETTPQNFLYDDIIGQYGYEKPAYYLFDVQNWEGATVHISWTICQEECFPQAASLKIRANPDKAEFEKAARSFPQILDEKLTIRKENENLILSLPKFATETDKIHFAPDERDILSPLTEQSIINKNNKLYLKAEPEPEANLPAHGLLWINDAAYQITLEPQAPDEPWALLLLLSFLGGIILNFMPCVFPILSLKALALTQAHKKRKDGLLYMAGVMVCFALMAAVLCLLRRSGSALGWGFQLRSPVFVSVMLLIFSIVFLLMTDIIKIRGRLQTLLDRFSSANAFLTGLFAVLIASPCSGPLLGAAVGYALLRSQEACLPIFLSMGLGYALPFTLVEAYPHALKKVLPAPGRWMGMLKKLLAIPVFLTCLWLGWLLVHLTAAPVNRSEALWRAYNPAEVERLLLEERPVFIDFTAKWCLTCLLNEKAVLETESFEKLAQTHHIALFKADWTTQDPLITKALENYDRASVPLYVYYPAGKNYVILPQILTYGILDEYLNEK